MVLDPTDCHIEAENRIFGILRGNGIRRKQCHRHFSTLHRCSAFTNMMKLCQKLTFQSHQDNGPTSQAQKLLRIGADPNYKHPTQEFTPVFAAAFRGNTALLKVSMLSHFCGCFQHSQTIPKCWLSGARGRWRQPEDALLLRHSTRRCTVPPNARTMPVRSD